MKKRRKNGSRSSGFCSRTLPRTAMLTTPGVMRRASARGSAPRRRRPRHRLPLPPALGRARPRRRRPRPGALINPFHVTRTLRVNGAARANGRKDEHLCRDISTLASALEVDGEGWGSPAPPWQQIRMAAADTLFPFMLCYGSSSYLSSHAHRRGIGLMEGAARRSYELQPRGTGSPRQGLTGRPTIRRCCNPSSAEIRFGAGVSRLRVPGV